MDRRKALRVALTVLTLALCAALCGAAVSLYAEGLARRAASGSVTEAVFTRENVGARLRVVAPVAGLWLAALITAAATGGLAPLRGKPARSVECTLNLLRARAGDLPPAAAREGAYRKKARAACGTVAALGFAAALVYLLNRAHFTEWDLERAVGDMLVHTLPPVALAFAALLVGARLCEKSRLREIDVLKTAPKASGGERPRAPMKGVAETPRRTAVRAALYVAAAALVALGVLNGGLNDVLVKAINICTECIGLG